MEAEAQITPACIQFAKPKCAQALCICVFVIDSKVLMYENRQIPNKDASFVRWILKISPVRLRMCQVVAI